MKFFKKIFILIAAIPAVLTSCGTPKELQTGDIPAVNKLDINRYLGTWYEIIRLDHPFERGLENVTATYELKEDGDIRVINRGWDVEDKEWSEAEGKAWRPEPDKEPGKFQVSFFLWFSSLYKVIKLDDDYQWAMVTSSSKEYLWILSREPELPDSTYNMLINFAKENGFPMEDLHKVKHDKNQ